MNLTSRLARARRKVTPDGGAWPSRRPSADGAISRPIRIPATSCCTEPDASDSWPSKRYRCDLQTETTKKLTKNTDRDPYKLGKKLGKNTFMCKTTGMSSRFYWQSLETRYDQDRYGKTYKIR